MTRWTWLIVLAGCAHEAPPVSGWQPAAGAPPPGLALAEVAADGPGAVAAVAQAHARVASEAEVLAWLSPMVEQLPPASLAASAGARQLAIESLYRTVRGGDFANQFARLATLIETMQSVAPTAPETLFGQAYVRWVLLDNGRDGLERSVIIDLERQLDALVHQHPTWQGPGELDHARLEREWQSVRTLLAEPVTPTTDVTPTR